MSFQISQQQQQQQNRTNKSSANQNIQVYVRVRPLNTRERLIRSQEVVEVIQPKEIVVHNVIDSKVTKKFTFDRTFGPDSRQSEVYLSVVAPLIEEVLAGYNCTVFAYGQTGTGKTHTMVGTEHPELKSSWEDESMVGIIPRALSHLFDELRMMEVEFSMRISYLELYNEELCDLLSSDDSSKIRIFDDGNKKGSVIIQGLEEIPVHSKDDVYKLLEKGSDRRKTATTLMNAQSSRSHTVFSILVHIKENGIDGEEMLKIGKLNLVDLAGSENVSKAGNEKGIRTRETVNINQSLLTLGRVITALVERTPHIPYRESKLTRILQESLGGRTKTSIIATISPGHKDLEETLSTLEYAHRAKNIQNKPEINQRLTKKTVLKEYTEEIDRLKRDLMAARDKNGIYLAEDTYNDMTYKLDSQNRELNEKVLLIKALKEDLASKERLFNEVSLHLIEKSDELVKKEKQLTETKTELTQTAKVLHTTKRRYKEKKVLLESHIKTEKDLTEQANQLIEVADTVTTDTKKLHDTIERRKDVDVKINTVCEQFVKKMENTFEQMGNDINLLCKEHKSFSKLISDDTDNNINQHSGFSKEILKSITGLSKHHETSLTELFSCIESFSNILSQSNTNHKDVILAKINEIKSKENELKIQFNEKKLKIIELVQKNDSLIEENYKRNLQAIENKRNEIEKKLEIARNNTSKYVQDINNSMCNEITKICSSVEKQAKISKKREEVLQNMMKQMQQLQNDDEIERENMQKVSKDIKLIQQNVITNKQEDMNSFDKFSTQCLNELTKVQNDLTEFRENSLKIKNQQIQEIQTEKELIEMFNDKQIQALNDIASSSEEHTLGNNNTIQQQINEISEQKSKSIEQMEKDYQIIQENVNNECRRIKTKELQNSSWQKSLENCIKNYSNDFNNHLLECNENLQSFYKSELKTYTPSGQTPSRKEYSYPRILAATSPHNRILKKRFKLDKNLSDIDTSTVTEDYDSTIYEISSDDPNCFSSISSTPIKSEEKTTNNINLLKDVLQNNFNDALQSNFNGINTTELSTKNTILSAKNSPSVCLNEEEDKENVG